MPFVGASKIFCTGIPRLFSSLIDLYTFSSTVLMIVLPGNKILSWLSVLSAKYRSGCSDKKRLCPACFPFNIWIVLEYWGVLRSVDAVFLFGDCSIQTSQSFSPSLFPNNIFSASLTVISMSCAIIIHFCGFVFMTLTAMTSLTEVAAVTFEKRLGNVLGP